jgi:hypothetical protein
VVGRSDLQRERDIEYDRDSTECQCPWLGCGCALALRNNVIIDINTTSPNPADSALKIANQIAANVTARW